MVCFHNASLLAVRIYIRDQVRGHGMETGENIGIQEEQCEGLVTENQVEPSNRFKKKHSILTLSFFSVNLYTFERTKMRTMKSVPLFQSNMADPIWPQFEHRDVISLSFDILQIFNRRARSIILHIRCVSKSLKNMIPCLQVVKIPWRNSSNDTVSEHRTNHLMIKLVSPIHLCVNRLD